MKVTWLGDAGLCFESERVRICINGVPNGEKGADIFLFTGALHLCEKALFAALEKNPDAIVLASRGAYEKAQALSEKYNVVPLAAHSVWSEKSITFYAVRAEGAERDAAGFILDDGSKTYYISGETLYNYEVLDDVLELVEDGVDYAFLPINGRGGCMNAKDAADFAYELGAAHAIPLFYGDRPGDPAAFDFEEGKIVLAPGETAEL